MIKSIQMSAFKFYQGLFRADNPGEARLFELHRSGNEEAFLREYFEHEVRKGAEVLQRFDRYDDGWEHHRVLDFGCGGGGMTSFLGTRFREAWGIDVDRRKLGFAEQQTARRGRENVRFTTTDSHHLPFEDDTFDTVLCVDVLEHLPNPQDHIAEIRRVLKPTGQLLLSFGPPWFHPHGKHMWTQIPGFWSHLLFPRSVLMEARGYDPRTTWEDIGIHKLSVRKFDRVMRTSGLERVHVEYRINPRIRLWGSVPVVRELFISEVVGVFRKSRTPGDA